MDDSGSDTKGNLDEGGSGIRLKLVGKRRKGRSSFKQLMEFRESDTENDSSVSTQRLPHARQEEK